MADNIQVNTQVTAKPALVTDLNSSYYRDGVYSHARNISVDNANGGTLSNEPSNTFCFDIPGNFLGSIDLNDDTHIIFSVDAEKSYIGIGDINNCTYTQKIVDNCLGFDKDLVLTGVAKKLFNGDVVATFGAHKYPVRRINLSDIPYNYTFTDDSCTTKVYSDSLNCDETLLFKKISYPCIDVSKGYGGNLPNGTYSILIVYTIDNQVFSDYSPPTQRIQIFEEVNNTSSLNVNISGLDREFNTYQVILISNIDGVKTNYIQGTYSTSQNTVQISDLGKNTIPTEALVLQKQSWESAGIISSNSNYILLSKLTAREELNYQKQALQIKARYIIKQVPLEYYEESPEEVGYWSDENYDFYIQPVYDTGEFAKAAHIRGRFKKESDKLSPVGEDVFEWDEDEKPLKLETWQTENTAQTPVPTNKPFINNTRIAYMGDMGYFESTEKYPDNIDLYGDDACTNIKYHKFPIVPRFENIDGKIYVNIKAIQFYNIPFPLDKNGKPIPGIKGYRILRSDRSGGNKTVISAGILTNVCYYQDQQNEREVMFSNFPFNDLRPNKFLSTSQVTFKNGSEQGFNPISTYYKDRFNYYSPHSLYNLKYRHGTEFKIISEDVAEVKGSFEPVYGHPMMKILSKFGFWVGIICGIIEAFFTASGERNRTTYAETGKVSGTATDSGTVQGTVAGFPVFADLTADQSAVVSFNNTSTSGTISSAAKSSALAATSDAALSAITSVIGSIRGGNAGLAASLKILKNVLKFIVSAGATAILFTVEALAYATNTLNLIYSLIPYVQYGYQYNAHAFYNQTSLHKKGNIRRKAILQPEYLSPSLHTIENTLFNNFAKQESVYVHLNREISNPSTEDTSRVLISDGSCDNPQKIVTTKSSVHYTLSKISNPNQYGQLGSNPQVLVSPCIHEIVYKDEHTTYSTPILFGGDCILARQTIITKQPLFRQNLAVEYANDLPTNFERDIEYNYNLYRNIGYTRFWVDNTKYDYSQYLKKQSLKFGSFSRSSASKYNFDCKKGDKAGKFNIEDEYFYLYVNGVLDFICEVDYNISFREKTSVPHYSKKNSNLSDILKSTNLAKQEQFKLSKSFYDIYPTEVFTEQLPSTYNPNKNNQTSLDNAVIYSIPSFNLQTGDNWQYFLPNNFFSFKESDFGTLTGVHKLDQDRLIFLFSKSSPYISMGRDFLELDQSGRKISIGDGGLFAQDPRESLPTDNNYGASTSPYAFSSNHFGYFYPSEDQTRIFNFTQQPEDILRNGNMSWGEKYMSIQLYKYFPKYPKIENPISGVGYILSFHPKKEILYISKKDYVPIFDTISYENSSFYYNGLKVELKDNRYFKDASWTLSYHLPTKTFISFHDWHPDWSIQTDKYFLTIRDNKLYKHDSPCDSYCNFYGVDYPFEIEPVFATGQNVEILKSIEYQIEGYKHINNCRDVFHELYHNFDKLQVSNSEQASPFLNIVQHPENPKDRLKYPKLNGIGFDILFTKIEQKFRINQFWDSVKDRGQHSDNKFHLFVNHPNGYERALNSVAIDLNKPEKERKKFRSTWTKARFIKTVSGATQFLIKFFNSKENVSIR